MSSNTCGCGTRTISGSWRSGSRVSTRGVGFGVGAGAGGGVGSATGTARESYGAGGGGAGVASTACFGPRENSVVTCGLPRRASPVTSFGAISGPLLRLLALPSPRFRRASFGGQEKVQQTELSPRINAAYAVAPLTVVRLAYNRLFTQPPLAQGAVIGESIKPQIVNLLEADLERQIGAYQAVKLAYYQKYFKNVTDTGILIEGTQIGAYTTHNLERAIAKGFELSYDLQPRGGIGPGAYFAWANVINKPSGKDSSTGEALPIGGYTDHDALNTMR